MKVKNSRSLHLCTYLHSTSLPSLLQSKYQTLQGCITLDTVIRCGLPRALQKKSYYFPHLGSNIPLCAALKITACLGTVLHCMCNSNLSSVFRHLSPLVILISRVILLLMDFRLFFLRSILVHSPQHLRSTLELSIHTLLYILQDKSYIIFEVVLCILQIDLNKPQEGKTNPSGRTKFWAQIRLEECVRKAGMGMRIVNQYSLSVYKFKTRRRLI